MGYFKMEGIDMIDWSKQHCGLFLATWDQALEKMPDIAPLLKDLEDILQHNKEDYFIDVKVHKLMPGQFPCIPNWHVDFAPRDENGTRIRDVLAKDNMYLWISGAPLAEFRNKNINMEAGKWIKFTQKDTHRGTMAEDFTWRGFIRVIPKWFKHADTKTCNNVDVMRIHSQVYLDAEKFKW